MKLRLASDLHLERTSDMHYIDSLIPHMPDDLETTLVLLGDIHVGTGARIYIDEMAKRFKYVIYIFGNHEFYGYNFYTLREKFHDKTSHIPNLFVLENDSVILDGQKFVGCTLWTDGDKENPFSMRSVEKKIHDYYLIEGMDGKILRIIETIAAHKTSLAYLREEVDEATVVLTHHVPLFNVLCDPMYKNSQIQGGFESDLAELILDLQPKYWLYGHNHYNIGVTDIGNTKLVSNQACYLHEPMSDYTPDFILGI